MCHTVFHSMCYVTKRLDPWNVNRPAWCIVQFCSHHLIKNVHCLLSVSFQVIEYRRFGSATFWTPKPGNETQLSTLFFSGFIHLTFNYCCYNMSMPHTVRFLPKPKWLNYLSNPNTDLQEWLTLLIAANKVFHVMKQDVTGWELRKGFLLD